MRAPFYELDGQVAVDLPGARAVFTTASWGDIRESLDSVATRLGVSAVRPRQVHGGTVIPADAAAAGTEADALYTAEPGIAPTVITADCVPIVIAAPGVVAAVHAGWRGLAADVIANAVAALRGRSGDRPLAAAIGPAAGACCYEVGGELHERFTGFSQGRNLDLKAIARTQLERAGVTTIHDVGICTICSDPSLLFSYRRDGAGTGRQAVLAWLS